MATKKFCQILLISLSLYFISPSYSFPARIGQTIQIHTFFTSIYGSPTWVLIVRDVRTGQVLPYVFDFYNEENFWVAFTAGRAYRIMASNLKFGPYAVVNNFCHLENGIIDGESYIVTLKGQLSPDPRSYRCFVEKYKNLPLLNYSI